MGVFERIFGDCLEKMDVIKDESVDLILTDLPYEETSNKLDIKIPFKPMWKQYERIIKPKGTILLFGQGMFYVDLVSSNKKLFKYDIIWNKVLMTGHLNAKRMPLRCHEQIAVFYKKLGTYNPQMTEGKPLHSKGKSYLTKEHKNQNYGHFNMTDDSRAGSTLKYPKSIVTFQKPHPSKAKHRTEKPVELLEWLIKTYSNEGDLVLDSCMGSGGTGEACFNTNRSFIGIEKDEIEFIKADNRLKNLINT